MSEPGFEQSRRIALQAASLLTATTPTAGWSSVLAGAPAAAPDDPAAADDSATKPAPGKPGDFDFLAGEWRIRHRRLKSGSTDDWDEFAGEASCFTILGGIASIEELRIPERKFSGMGLRLLDASTRVWNDFWVNAASGVLSVPGMAGHFKDGVGTFSADDLDGEQPIRVRGVWDRITPTSCRWQQAVSRDGGATWVTNWSMDWKRA